MVRYYTLNSFRLCIDKIEDNLCIGRVYTPLYSKALVFKDLTNMVLLMDEVFDNNNFPRAYQNKRSFKESNITGKKAEIKFEIEKLLREKGEVATFDIIVTSRQHTCWQGIIKNMDGEIINSFKSELNLIDFLFKALI
ncbi:hypothetical protein [Thomasclavelia sp.]